MIGASLKQLEQRYGTAKVIEGEPPVFVFSVRGATLEASLLDGFAGHLRVEWPSAPLRAEPLLLLEELSVIPHWAELPASDPRRAEHFPDAPAESRFFAADDGGAVGLVDSRVGPGALVLLLSAKNYPRQRKAWLAARPR